MPAATAVGATWLVWSPRFGEPSRLAAAIAQEEPTAHRHAIRDIGQGEVLPVELERLRVADDLGQLLRAPLRRDLVQPAQDHRELVPAVAGDQFALAARILQQPGDGADRAIPRDVPKGVVELLQA